VGKPCDVGMYRTDRFSSAMTPCSLRLLLMRGTDFRRSPSSIPAAPGFARQRWICGPNRSAAARRPIGVVGDVRATIEGVLPRIKE